MKEFKAMDCYNYFKQLMDIKEYGHGWMHKNMSIQDLVKRLSMDRNCTMASYFTISEDEFIEQMLFAAENAAEDIANWINNEYSPVKVIQFECDQIIGKVLGRGKKWNTQTGANGSLLVIVLKRIADNNSYHDLFKITTEYVGLTQDEWKNLDSQN